jgi:hypothetical protein
MKPYFDYLTIVLWILMIACHSCSHDTKVKFPDYLPEELIISNFQDADFVVAMQINKVSLNPEESIRDDNEKIGYAALIYEGEIFHSYKGNLKKDRIVFRHVQEYDDGLVKRLNETKMSKIVFLKKGANEGDYIAPEFTIFTYSKELHSALIDYMARQ